MKRREVVKYTQGAMTIALVMAFLIVNQMLAGTLTFYVPFILPLPILLYVQQFGIKAGLLVCFVISILAFFYSPIFISLVAIIYVFIGLLVGYNYYKNIPDKIAYFISLIGVLISYYLSYFVFGAVLELDINQEFQALFDMVIKMTPQFKSYLNNMGPYLIMMSLIVIAMLECLVILMLADRFMISLKRPTLPKLKLSEIHYPPNSGLISFSVILVTILLYRFTHQLVWLYPGVICYVYLLCLGVLSFYKFEPMKKYKLIGYLGIYITLPFLALPYSVLGLSTLLLDKWK